MKKTSLSQKVLLVSFALILTLVLLEIGMRIAGGVVLYLQERHNHASFNQNEYRILCLGESTTALGGEDSYPSQLARMLNAQGQQKKISVINKGIISTTTEYILAHLDQNLDLYKPQLVVLMMGINDKVYMHDPYKSLWWENIKLYLKEFKVYKLGRLLYEHITHRIKEINVPAKTFDLSDNDDGNDQQMEDFLKLIINKCIERLQGHMANATQYQHSQQFALAQQEKQFAQQSLLDASRACVELARRYRFQASFLEAQKILDQATIFDHNYQDLYQEWGEFYLAQGESVQAVKAFQVALEFDSKRSDSLLGLARAYYQEHNDYAFLFYAKYLQTMPQDYWGYIELAQWLREAKHYDWAREYLSHALELRPNLDQAYVDWGQILNDEGQFVKEEAFYLKAIAMHPQSPRINQALGQFYQGQGKENLAKEYFQKAAEQGVAEYYPATLVNYSLILNKILSRHIKVVVMQYPVRDIGPLKDYLGKIKGVVFVENRNNFKRALAVGGYGRYFKDNFANDFGHCTRLGNELIARNLTSVILSEVKDLKGFSGARY